MNHSLNATSSSWLFSAVHSMSKTSISMSYMFFTPCWMCRICIQTYLCCIFHHSFTCCKWSEWTFLSFSSCRWLYCLNMDTSWVAPPVHSAIQLNRNEGDCGVRVHILCRRSKWTAHKQFSWLLRSLLERGLKLNVKSISRIAQTLNVKWHVRRKLCAGNVEWVQFQVVGRHQDFVVLTSGQSRPRLAWNGVT